MNDYGPKDYRGYRYILVVIANFSNIVWTILLKNKYAQSLTDAFSRIIKASNRKLDLLEKDDGKEYLNKTFNEVLNTNNMKRYSCFTDNGAVFAERFNRTIRNLLKEPVFEKRNANWLSELPPVIKQNNNTTQHSMKMTPIQAAKKLNEKIVHNNLKYKGEIQKPKFKIRQLVRTADVKRVFSKVDSTNWSYKLYTTTEVIHDTIASYRIN